MWKQAAWTCTKRWCFCIPSINSMSCAVVFFEKHMLYSYIWCVYIIYTSITIIYVLCVYIYTHCVCIYICTRIHHHYKHVTLCPHPNHTSFYPLYTHCPRAVSELCELCIAAIPVVGGMRWDYFPLHPIVSIWIWIHTYVYIYIIVYHIIPLKSNNFSRLSFWTIGPSTPP
jgi:hypothetical protein